MMKENFPIYQRRPNLIYLDTAATALKPQVMIDAMTHFYAETNAPVHRGGYALANDASRAYEESRTTVAKFMGADSNQLVFTSGATEGANLIAQALQPKKILSCEAEHHSNLLPWMRQGELILSPYYPDTYIDFEFTETQLKKGDIDIVAISGLSNVLGQGPDLDKLIKLAHQYHAKVFVDGTQLVCHTPHLDVQKLNCDFFVFSGHKLYGPTGIGGLYIKDPSSLSSPKVGGGMVETASSKSFQPLPGPQGWEAGTPPAAQAIGLAATVQWLQDIQWETYLKKEEKERARLKKGLQDLGATLFGKGEQSLISCSFEGVNTEDLATLLGAQDICVRAGKHCAHPLHCTINERFSTLRFSLGIYTDQEDIDRTLIALADSLKRIR